jgi:hypothetical protein
MSMGDETVAVLDPGNPLRVGGAFGDHSWLSLSYRPPAWLEVPPLEGKGQCLVVQDTPVGQVDVEGLVTAGADGEDQLALLRSHDGPEMDHLGELTRFVGAVIATEQLPPLRVGLLSPGSRDERQAANPDYADALCEHVLPPCSRPPRARTGSS